MLRGPVSVLLSLDVEAFMGTLSLLWLWCRGLWWAVGSRTGAPGSLSWDPTAECGIQKVLNKLVEMIYNPTKERETWPLPSRNSLLGRRLWGRQPRLVKPVV